MEKNNRRALGDRDMEGFSHEVMQRSGTWSSSARRDHEENTKHRTIGKKEMIEKK